MIVSNSVSDSDSDSDSDIGSVSVSVSDSDSVTQTWGVSVEYLQLRSGFRWQTSSIRAFEHNQQQLYFIIKST